MLFLSLTVIAYIIDFIIDFSSDYFTFYRILIIILSYYFFYKLSFTIKIINNINIKFGNKLPALFLCIIHLIFINYFGEKFNRFLLNSENRTTIGTIKDCYTSKSTEYCVYSYFDWIRHRTVL